MISGNLNADVEQLYLDSGVVKVADFGLSKSLVPVDRHGQMSMSLTQVELGVMTQSAWCRVMSVYRPWHYASYTCSPQNSLVV